MSYTVRKLIDPSDTKLEEVKIVLSAAFTADDAFRAVVGPAFEKLLPALIWSQLIAGRLAGDIYIAEDSNRNIIGAAIWFGPGRELYDSEDQNKLALVPLMKKFPVDVKEWYISVTPRMDAFKKAIAGEAPRMHWFLQRVGVLPDWQGKGVGTALINEVLKKSGGLRIILQAINSSNVLYYEHLGFRVKGSIDINALHGNFTVFLLSWDPCYDRSRGGAELDQYAPLTEAENPSYPH